MAKKYPDDPRGADLRYNQDKTTLFAMRIPNSTGIPATLRREADKAGLTPAMYIRQALLEKWQRDGVTIEKEG